MDNPNLRPSVLWYKEGNPETGLVKTNFISFTATMEENHRGTNTVSKYPVQKGFEVANHVIRHNRTINIRAYIPENMLGGTNVEGAEAGFALGAMSDKYLGTSISNLTSVVGGIATDPFGVAGNYLQGAISAAAPVVGTIADVVDDTVGWFLDDNPFELSGEEGLVGRFLPSTSRRIDTFEQLDRIRTSGTLCSLSTVLKEYSDLILVDFSAPTNADAYTVLFVDLVFEEVLIVGEAGQLVTTITGSKVPAKERREAQTRVEKFHDSGATSFVKEAAVDAKDWLGGLIP